MKYVLQQEQETKQTSVIEVFLSTFFLNNLRRTI